MNTEYSFNYERIIEEYNRQITSNRKKISKVLNVLLLIYLVTMTLIYLIFPDVLNNSNSKTTYYVIGGIVGIPLVIGSLLNQLVTSEKPFYNFVIKEIVNYVNNTNNQNYKYSAYPKKTENINKKGGIFTRGATINIKNQISGKTQNNYEFTSYNMRMYTTDGKNHYILFNGIYFVINYPVGKVFQIRSHTKPRLKDTKFKKVDVVDGLKIFTVKDELSNSIDSSFIDTVKYIKDKYKAKKIYLSVVNDHIHLAMETTVPLKRPKELNKNTLNSIIDNINSRINIPDEVINKLN